MQNTNQNQKNRVVYLTHLIEFEQFHQKNKSKL